MISGWEHRALHRPALMLEELGVELVVIPPDGAQPLDLSKLQAELKKAQAKVDAAKASAGEREKKRLGKKKRGKGAKR